MEQDPIATDLRRKRRERELGTGAICVLCGEADLSVLMRAKKQLIEDHHVLGQNHDAALTVPVCRNCHAKLHERYRQAAAMLEVQPSFLERLAMILRALGVFLRSLGEKFAAWADWLLSFVAQLDERDPAWREELDAA